MEKKNTFKGEFATTLRLSSIGYTSDIQNKLNLSWNSLEDYIRTICFAVNTTHPPFSSFSGEDQAQLNDHYLQLENELYSVIRPKQTPQKEERVLDALMDRGIQYIEVRLFDNDFQSPIAIQTETLEFCHVFLLYCLLSESPSMTTTERNEWITNQERITWFGRNPGLTVLLNNQEVSFQEWLNQTLNAVQSVLPFMDDEFQNRLKYIFEKQMNKIQDVSLTPSAIQLEELKNSDLEFWEYGLELSLKHKNELTQNQLPLDVQSELESIARDSLQKQNQIDKASAHITNEVIVASDLKVCCYD